MKNKKPIQFNFCLFISMLSLLASVSCKKAPNTYKIMLVHASTGADIVDFYLQGNIAGRNILFGENTGYLEAIVEGDDKFVAEVKASTTGSLLATEFDPDLIAEAHYSLYIFGNTAELSKVLLNDSYEEPQNGHAMVRFVHMSADAPALDVLANGVPVVTNKAYYGNSKFNGATGFQEVLSGNYTISFQTNGTGDMIMSAADINLEAGKIYTLYAKGLLNGTGAHALDLGVVRMK
jgi:hypothetical protein